MASHLEVVLWRSTYQHALIRPWLKNYKSILSPLNFKTWGRLHLLQNCPLFPSFFFLSLFFLKAGPPPWFEFFVIFDFFAPWYRKSREASSVKISWKNSKGKLVKCAIEVARLHRVSIQSCTCWYKRLMIGPELWNSELRINSCVCYVIQSCTQNRPPPKVQSLSRDWI